MCVSYYPGSQDVGPQAFEYRDPGLWFSAAAVACVYCHWTEEEIVVLLFTEAVVLLATQP